MPKPGSGFGSIHSSGGGEGLAGVTVRGGGGGKRGGGRNAPKFTRQVPKFLQQYAHLLGAERPDPHANDAQGYTSTAIAEGYDDDGDQVVGEFLRARREEAKRKEKEEAAAAAAEAAEQEAIADAIARGDIVVDAGGQFRPSSSSSEDRTGTLPAKVIFRASANKRSADSMSSSGKDTSSGSEALSASKDIKEDRSSSGGGGGTANGECDGMGVEKPASVKKRKRNKKKLDNAKLLSFDTEDGEE